VYDKTLDQDLAGTLSCTMSDVCICMNKVSNIHLLFLHFADVIARDFGVHEDANVMSQIESQLKAARMQADTQEMRAKVCTIWGELLAGGAKITQTMPSQEAVNAMKPRACLQPMLQYLQQNLWVVLMYCLWAEHCCCYATASKSSIDEADATLLKKLEKIVMFNDNDKHLRRFALDPLLQSTIDDIRKTILFIQHEASGHVALHNTIECDGKNEVLYRVIAEGRHLFFTMNCTRPIRIFDKCRSHMHVQSLALKNEDSGDSDQTPAESPEKDFQMAEENDLLLEDENTKDVAPQQSYRNNPLTDETFTNENMTSPRPMQQRQGPRHMLRYTRH
tara:strand:+ start:327 stop:1328 length:1002 start_codon:yes stop_codon:yes gene_type:complete